MQGRALYEQESREYRSATLSKKRSGNSLESSQKPRFYSLFFSYKSTKCIATVMDLAWNNLPEPYVQFGPAGSPRQKNK